VNTRPSIERQRAMAMTAYPVEWAATISMQGEKRRRAQKELRDKAIYEARMKPLRAKGASCATCHHWSKFDATRMQCDLESHFITGSLLTDATHLCPEFLQKKK
jgi:hypothetical protein